MQDSRVDLGNGYIPVSDMPRSALVEALADARDGLLEVQEGADEGACVENLILRLEIELLIREKGY